MKMVEGRCWNKQMDRKPHLIFSNNPWTMFPFDGFKRIMMMRLLIRQLIAKCKSRKLNIEPVNCYRWYRNARLFVIIFIWWNIANVIGRYHYWYNTLHNHICHTFGSYNISTYVNKTQTKQLQLVKLN